MDNHMNRGIAVDLAARGYRVVLLNFLGHGESDKPLHAAEYRTDGYARQVLALLDHLGWSRPSSAGCRWAPTSRCWPPPSARPCARAGHRDAACSSTPCPSPH